MLQLTDQAVAKVKQLLAAENKKGHGLRVAVQGGGCSGFQYGLTWENEQRDNDVKIDYVDGLQGSGFKIENPNATGTCGCGSSFSV